MSALVQSVLPDRWAFFVIVSNICICICIYTIVYSIIYDCLGKYNIYNIYTIFHGIYQYSWLYMDATSYYRNVKWQWVGNSDYWIVLVVEKYEIPFFYIYIYKLNFQTRRRFSRDFLMIIQNPMSPKYECLCAIDRKYTEFHIF